MKQLSLALIILVSVLAFMMLGYFMWKWMNKPAETKVPTVVTIGDGVASISGKHGTAAIVTDPMPTGADVKTAIDNSIVKPIQNVVAPIQNAIAQTTSMPVVDISVPIAPALEVPRIGGLSRIPQPQYQWF